MASLAIPFEPLVKDIVFTRLAGGDCIDSAFCQRCTGTFQQDGTTAVVGQDSDGRLTLTIGGQPTNILRLYQDRTFVIGAFEAYRVEFRLGPGAEVDELVFHQPNESYVARRV